MIRGFQEANFDENYTQTTRDTGYGVPSFEKLAYAYDFEYSCVKSEKDVKKVQFGDKPQIIEIKINEKTYWNPNFGRNGLIQDQRPYLDRNIFNALMEL